MCHDRYTTNESDEIPFTINCWPNLNKDGTCNVNVEYDLVATDLKLTDVEISIPVSECVCVCVCVCVCACGPF
jgi:hypothetical protein